MPGSAVDRRDLLEASHRARAVGRLMHSADVSQTQAVVRPLNALAPLPDAGIAAVVKAIGERVLSAGPGEDIVREGDQPDRVRMILSGWLTRYKTLEDGRRQIVNFLLPGDTCDAQIYLLRQMDHSIGTLTPVV
jgi:CRP-like cAMP-binding protein